MFRTLKFVFFVFVLIFGANSVSYTQKSVEIIKETDLSAKQLENIQIKTQSLEQICSRLSIFYDIPISLETALNANEVTPYIIDFDKGNLPDLLTQIIDQANRAQDQYEWEIKDNVVNIFPKDKYRDLTLKSLLETNISSFSVKEKTGAATFTESLVETPEIKKFLETNGISYRRQIPNGFYIPQLGSNFTLNVSNITLRSILDKVIKESPTARMWTIERDSDSPQTFSIYVFAKQGDFNINR